MDKKSTKEQVEKIIENMVDEHNLDDMTSDELIDHGIILGLQELKEIDDKIAELESKDNDASVVAQLLKKVQPIANLKIEELMLSRLSSRLGQLLTMYSANVVDSPKLENLSEENRLALMQVMALEIIEVVKKNHMMEVYNPNNDEAASLCGTLTKFVEAKAVEDLREKGKKEGESEEETEKKINTLQELGNKVVETFNKEEE